MTRVQIILNDSISSFFYINPSASQQNVYLGVLKVFGECLRSEGKCRTTLEPAKNLEIKKN